MKRTGYLIKWSLFCYGLSILSVLIYTLLIVKIFHINIPDDDLIPNFISLIIVAPIVEELIFRGPIYFVVKSAIENNEPEEMKSSIFIMILLLGVTFGLMHITNIKPFTWGAIWYAMARIPTGIIYGWVVYRTKSLIPTIIAHGLVNFTALYILRN